MSAQMTLDEWIPEDERAVVLVQRPGQPAVVLSKHCPIGCFDLCHAPDLCQKPPAQRTPEERARIATFHADVEADAELELSRVAADEARREPVPEEQAAYAATWTAQSSSLSGATVPAR
jgi:hypothetical protein